MSIRPVNGSAPTHAPRRRLGVIVVDPLPVVRAGLGLLIDDRPDMEVLAEAGTADEGIEAIQRVRRSMVVVLVGLGLSGDHDAYWLIRTLRQRYPTHAILGCGANADPTAISRALFVGADGFVDKNIDPVDFLQALRKAATREMVLATPTSSVVGQIVEGIDRIIMPYRLGHRLVALSQSWLRGTQRSNLPRLGRLCSRTGHNLHRERLNKNLSQEQVAYRAKLSRFTYQKYESGLSRPGRAANPTLLSIIAIAQVLNVDITDLLPGKAPDLTSR